MRTCIIGSLKQLWFRFRDVVYPLEMVDKTGPYIWGYIMVPQVICLPMVCRGSRVWQVRGAGMAACNINLWQLHSREPYPVLVF